jgi:hypothetical protein
MIRECRIGDGGVSDVASLLKASPWRQYVVLMPPVPTWYLVAQGMSLQGVFILVVLPGGVFFKTGQVLPLLADSRRSRADGTLTRVVSMKWFFGCSRGWSPFGSCWAWHVLVVVVVAVVVANLLISGGGRKAL